MTLLEIIISIVSFVEGITKAKEKTDRKNNSIEKGDKNCNNVEKKNRKYYYYVFICLLIAVILYFSNLGPVRLLFAPLPAIILLIYYCKINEESINLIDETNKMHLFVIWGGITLILSSLLFPDHDINQSGGWVFFMQIRDERIVSLCDTLFTCMFICHVIIIC